MMSVNPNHDPKQTISFLKHGVDSVVRWACIARFDDDVVKKMHYHKNSIVKK